VAEEKGKREGKGKGKGRQGKARFYLGGGKKEFLKPRRQTHHLPLPLHRSALMRTPKSCLRTGSC